LALNQLGGLKQQQTATSHSHTPNSNLRWLRTTYYRTGNKRVAKRLWACISNSCCKCWHRTLFR